MTQLPAVEKQEEHLRLRIFLQPKASKDQIVGLHGNELKITITAPPIDGQANAHLLKFLSKTFKVPKSSIVLEKGELNRHKQILIPNPKVIPEEIIALLKTGYKLNSKILFFVFILNPSASSIACCCGACSITKRVDCV